MKINGEDITPRENFILTAPDESKVEVMHRSGILMPVTRGTSERRVLAVGPTQTRCREGDIIAVDLDWKPATKGDGWEMWPDDAMLFAFGEVSITTS